MQNDGQLRAGLILCISDIVNPRMEADEKLDEVSVSGSPVKIIRRQSAGDSSSGCSGITSSSMSGSRSGEGTAEPSVINSISSSFRGSKMRHPYMLHVRLHNGISLVARDSNGSSDPFVK